MYDLVIKDGLVIDPFQELYEEKDVAVSNGKIEAVESNISSSGARSVIDAKNMIVVPGLIDLHTHVSYNVVMLGVDPEQACLKKGVTTVVDAGSTGHLNFIPFKKYVIEKSRARIFVMLNIESLGMIEFMHRSSERWPELLSCLNGIFIPLFVNVEETVRTVEENRDIILGVKWAHHHIRGLELARKVADKVKCVIMAENHYIPDSLKYLKKGDILTHLYVPKNKEKNYGCILDDCMKVLPEYLDALKRGVILDVGHGRGSFSWKIAENAIKEGIKPDTISTDLWVGNINGPVYDLPTTMSKFLLLGISLEEVIKATTTKPAEVLGRLGEIGTLKPGSCADITILKVVEGKFVFEDSFGEKRIGYKKLEPVHVISGGLKVL
ncbi:MAG: amidohydrolase/deacetylase family metallohydrolase [Candidatus Micrarchaeia archaeon]